MLLLLGLLFRDVDFIINNIEVIVYMILLLCGLIVNYVIACWVDLKYNNTKSRKYLYIVTGISWLILFVLVFVVIFLTSLMG